jgi:phenylalanyl-tRNA synthetase beta chain
MKTSVRWLNEYLEPADVSPEAAEHALTGVGFPIEEAVRLPDADTMLDVEVTSNRGDCISHIGLAREIAAATGRRLRLPAIPDHARSGEASSLVHLDNQVPQTCRLFTLRIIRGVKVGPSPEWLVRALASVGQRSINNVVDATNYVMFELGQPTHAFDLARVGKDPSGVPQVIVRGAAKGEKLTLLDGRRIELAPGELVVCDPSGPISLAGIMGGLGSEVTDSTTDVLLEAATWDPLTVRRAARRLQVSTDACYRFERRVDPRTIELAARRVADIIMKTGGPGARIVTGVVEAGAPAEPLTRVTLRPARCRAIMGVDTPSADMIRALRAHDVQVTPQAPTGDAPLECTIPAHRPDLEREIDLIEEVARTLGLDKIPTLELLPVRPSAPQNRERAARELAGALTGLGFFETITFSFVSPEHAAPFLPRDLRQLQLCDERRKADPVLRPSILPSLLACRAANQNAGAAAPNGVRLFETASVFAQAGADGLETRVLALYADAVTSVGCSKGFDARQEAFRFMRGAIEGIVRALGGPEARAEFAPVADLPFAALDANAAARVEIVSPSGERTHAGTCGLLTPAVLRAYDLDTPGVVAELNLAALLALFPARSLVNPLPLFPGIERDVSFIVPEQTPWSTLDQLVAGANLERLEGWEFVTAYRGAYRDADNAEHNLAKQGKKAVTLRLRFRDPARTLRREEVDPQVATLVQLASSRCQAQVRA